MQPGQSYLESGTGTRMIPESVVEELRTGKRDGRVASLLRRERDRRLAADAAGGTGGELASHTLVACGGRRVALSRLSLSFTATSATNTMPMGSLWDREKLAGMIRVRAGAGRLQEVSPGGGREARGGAVQTDSPAQRLLRCHSGPLAVVSLR